MRLLFVHDRFGAMAGAEVNLHLTAAEFKSRGHSVGILHGSSTDQGEAAWKQIFESRFPLGARNGFEAARSAIRQFEPDAIYVHKMSDVQVLKALVESGCATVRMVHDHDLYCLRSYRYFPHNRNICTRSFGPFCAFPCGGVLERNRNGGWPLRLRSYRAKKLELALNRRFQRVIVATEYMRDQLLKNGFEPEQIEIHAPVPRNNELCFQSSFSTRNRIVYSGQVIRGKGVDVLIESLAKVQLPFECIILGDGNHRAYCEELSRRLKLNGTIQFAGYRPPDELRHFYSEASLAVMSSVWPEPFGAAGLEAMRHGLPVVAFDAGGIGEWLKNGWNGFLVPWMDRAGFAARIEELLRDKIIGRKLGENGRQMLAEKFSFAGYMDGLENLFERVIGGKPIARRLIPARRLPAPAACRAG